MYGIFACISLMGLAFSFLGGSLDLIGTVVVAIANGMSVSMALKEHCPTPKTEPVAVAENT